MGNNRLLCAMFEANTTTRGTGKMSAAEQLQEPLHLRRLRKMGKKVNIGELIDGVAYAMAAPSATSGCGIGIRFANFATFTR